MLNITKKACYNNVRNYLAFTVAYGRRSHRFFFFQKKAGVETGLITKMNIDHEVEQLKEFIKRLGMMAPRNLGPILQHTQSNNNI